MNNAPPVIRLRSVIEYADAGKDLKPILDRVSLDVPRATSVGILGESKSGKSTLARLMAGQIKPRQGSVEINGNVSWAAYMPIKPMPSLTMRDYVHFIARMYSADPDHVLYNVSTIAGFPQDQKIILGDLDRIDRGKFFFAMKFAFDFDCYILDEFSTTSDPVFRLLADTIMERLRRRRAFVILGKSERVLRRSCDVVYRLDAGQLTLAPQAPSLETA